MSNSQTHSTVTASGRIDSQVHDVSTLKNKIDDDWETLTEQQKMQVCRDVTPEYTDSVYNVTTVGLHEYFVDNLNPGDTSSAANVTALWLGLGNNGDAGTNEADTDLNSREYSEQVTNAADEGKDLRVSTFLDSEEGNGVTFNELGVFSGDPQAMDTNDDIFMLNHASFAPVTKDGTKTVTFDVTLSFTGQ